MTGQPGPERPEPTPDQVLLAVLLGSVIALGLGMLAAPLLRELAEATLTAWNALLSTFQTMVGWWADVLNLLAHTSDRT